LSVANEAYYCEGKSLMEDSTYDILREYTLKEYPENLVAKEQHKHCKMEAEKSKVKLPYEMWSMDKIKPDTEALKKWTKDYKGPYVLSCKLDGISALYTTEDDEAKLYTRGNGKIGQDISYLIPYLQLPKTKDITIRGELIIPKQVFKDKYSKTFSNARNMVAGLVNQKKNRT